MHIFEMSFKYNGGVSDLDIYNTTSFIHGGIIIEALSGCLTIPLELSILIKPIDEKSSVNSHEIFIYCNDEERTVKTSFLNISFKLILDILSSMRYFKGSKLNDPAFIERMTIINKILH